MAHKKKHVAPVPPGNQPPSGPPDATAEPLPEQEPDQAQEGGDQQQDPKRRLGDFTGKGEHSIQQPGGKNDSNH